MKKRGLSHVEIIFSFIIFVSAILFALYFFRPFDTDRLVDSSLDYAFREIIQNSSIEIERFSVKINNGLIPSGVSVIGIEISGADVNKKARAVTRFGEVLSTSRTTGTDIFYVKKLSDFSSVDFIELEISEEFNEDSFSGDLNFSYYDISSSETKEIISENRFNALKQNYDNDYSDLRNKFNLPNRVNFAFYFEFSDGSVISAEREIPDSLEVFSEEKRVEILRTNGERVFGKLGVKVW